MDFTRNKIQFAITDLGGGKLGEKIPMHVHAKDCYELHFVIEGKGTLIADGREIELKKNDFFINFLALKIPPDVYSTSRGLFFYCPFFTDLFIMHYTLFIFYLDNLIFLILLNGSLSFYFLHFLYKLSL